MTLNYSCSSRHDRLSFRKCRDDAVPDVLNRLTHGTLAGGRGLRSSPPMRSPIAADPRRNAADRRDGTLGDGDDVVPDAHRLGDQRIVVAGTGAASRFRSAVPPGSRVAAAMRRRSGFCRVAPPALLRRDDVHGRPRRGRHGCGPGLRRRRGGEPCQLSSAESCFFSIWPLFARRLRLDVIQDQAGSSRNSRIISGEARATCTATGTGTRLRWKWVIRKPPIRLASAAGKMSWTSFAMKRLSTAYRSA